MRIEARRAGHAGEERGLEDDERSFCRQGDAAL